MEGTRLEQYPATFTTFSTFKRYHPHGQLLKKPDKGQPASGYADYFAQPDRLGIFGRINDFQRLEAKDQVFGLRLADREIAVAKSYLNEQRYKIIDSGNTRIIIYYDRESNSAAAYALPHLMAQQLSVLNVKAGQLTIGTQHWNLLTGQPTAGNGNPLVAQPLISAFWFAWASFFPETELIK